MKIKKFQGKTFKEVMEIVKNELGPDAIIISSNTKKDPLSNNAYVELTAAFEDNDDSSPNFYYENQNNSLEKEIEKIRIELALLRESVMKLFPPVDDRSKGSLFSFMMKIGIEPHLALYLLEKASDMEGLREVLDKEIKVLSNDLQNERGYIFFGLPGVGKTTSLFKLGRQLRNKNQGLLILSLDQRISAVAQIKEVSLRLKCQSKIVKDNKELYRLVHKEIEKTKILIDTPGDQLASNLSELRSLLRDVPIRKCLIMDASMATASSIKTLRSIDSEMIDCIAFSKLDLAHNYGNIYNLSVYSGKPVGFITSGAYNDEKAILYPPRNISNFILGGLCEN